MECPGLMPLVWNRRLPVEVAVAPESIPPETTPPETTPPETTRAATGRSRQVIDDPLGNTFKFVAAALDNLHIDNVPRDDGQPGLHSGNCDGGTDMTMALKAMRFRPLSRDASGIAAKIDGAFCANRGQSILRVS